MARESNAYFEKEADSVLPDFKINNIIVEQGSIRMFCSLDRDSDLDYDSWFGSSDFLKYVNFYFILTGRLTASSLSKIYYPKTRIQSLKNGAGENGLLNWEETFKLRNVGIGSMQRQTRFNGKINPLYGYIKVNMDEITRGDPFVTNTKKTFGAVSTTSLINGSGFTNIDPEDDTFFEVEMACDEQWLSIDQTNQADHHRNIVAFCQLDVKALATEYGLESFIGTLSEYGGPMHYEKVLELSPYVGTAGRSSVERMWQVPKTVNYFEDQQGNPHKGLAHYHGQNNPGPNGYIGWMSGPPGDGGMSGRKLLSRREIRNTKVISKIHVATALGFDGLPLKDDGSNSFQGYPDVLSTTGDSVPSPYGSLSFGEDLLSTLRSEVGMGMLEVQSGEAVNTLDTIKGSKMKRLVLTKEMAARPNFVESIATFLSTRNSNYSTYFSISKESILKLNSQYGYLIDFHKDAISDLPNFEQLLLSSANEAQKQSYNFIKNCIERTKIYTMKIKRRRVTNLSSINNAASVPDYKTYDNNQIPEHLITFSDSNDEPAGIDNTIKADFQEIVENFYGHKGFTSVYRIEDYDLYNNVTHGRYRYSIELCLIDGAAEYLKDFYDQYQTAFKNFSNYVKEAEKPYIRNLITREDVELDNGGSYDYEREQFSQKFIDERTEEFQTAIERAVGIYMEASYLLNKKQSFFNNQFRTELIDGLLPDSADIGNLKMFLDMMQKVGNSIKSRLFKNETDIEKTLNLGTHKRRVGAGFSFPSSLIKLDSDIAGSVKVESKNSVFFTVGEASIDDNQEVSEFFTLQSEVLPRSELQESNENPDVPFPISYNSAGEVLSRSTTHTRRVIGPLANNYSEIISATEYSPYGESFDNNTENQHSNPLVSHNSTLNNFGGATFNYLLTKTLSLAETSTNECGEQINTISSTVEQAIFDSIVITDNREDFLEQVEEQHKGYYFTKEALGNLYTFIKRAMSNRDTLRNMTTRRAETRLQRYRHRVERGISTEQHRSQTSRLRREAIDDKNMVLTDLYVYTSSNGFVPADTEPVDSLGIFERRSRKNIKTRNGTEPVITDNVYVDTRGTSSTIALSDSQTQSGAPMRSSTSNRGPSTGRTTRSVGITTGGGYSGGGGGSSSGY